MWVGIDNKLYLCTLMATTLTIDQGNSRAKVAVWDGDRLMYAEVVLVLTAPYLSELAVKYNVHSAIFCSVTKHSDSLLNILNEAAIPTVQLTNAVPTPLKIDYKTPSTLGVDRIAAAVGAISLFPDKELLIVDAGTAVTYDRVTSRGHFAGGNIAPGIGMRLRALHAFTAKLPEISSRGETQLWGTSTETALRSGAVNGVIAEISYYRSRLPQGAIVVISGGWGRDLASKLNFEAYYDDALVNRGLNNIMTYNNLITSILSYNENK